MKETEKPFLGNVAKTSKQDSHGLLVSVPATLKAQTCSVSSLPQPWRDLLSPCSGPLHPEMET